MPEDKGIIVDISGGGLRLFSKKQYDADSIVNVSFPIQVGDRSRYMKLMAKVVMSMRNQNSDSVYDSRLQFVNMQKEDTEDIVKYVCPAKNNSQERKGAVIWQKKYLS